MFTSLQDSKIPRVFLGGCLGVTMDSHLQMTSQVNNVCKSAYLSSRNIGKIRKYISLH